MAAEVTVNIVDGARWVERYGDVVEISAVALVRDLLPDPLLTQDEVIKKALATAGVPVAGDAHPHEGALVLEERIPVPLSTGTIQIELVYRLPGGNANIPPPGDTFVVSGGSASEQFTTELDRMGNQITVWHNGQEQGGEIHAWEARDSLTLEEVFASLNPWALTRLWKNTVNQGTFAFDPTALPRTWRISDITFDLDNRTVSPPKYRFRWELLHNPDGHDPIVVYIDPKTGRPPAGLVLTDPGNGQVGWKRVPWHVERDFSTIFGAVPP